MDLRNTSDGLSDFISETNSEIWATFDALDVLSFEIKHGEGVFARFHVAYTQLSAPILTPTPRCAIQINRGTHRTPNAYISNRTWDGQDFLGICKFAKRTDTPQE